MHHEYKTTKPLVLSIHPCLVYNCMFHCCDIIVASYKCMYHAWCFGFHMQLSTRCKNPTCGVIFDQEWQESMGFETIEDDHEH